MTEPLQILPANCFTIQQLTEAYNRTRVDYLVPMPMNAVRLAEYIQMYDIDLQRSFVVLDNAGILGLGMLGIRPGRAWITRLGVLPTARRRGQGLALMQALLTAAIGTGLDFTVLEVIQNNTPAQTLFLKLGFREVNELVILRRPPAPPNGTPAGAARWLTRSETLDQIGRQAGPAPWTNQAESFGHAAQVYGLALTAPQGSGWAAFMVLRSVITHLILNTDQGDPAAIGAALLAHIHQQYPQLDTHAENIATHDPHLPALYAAGYLESFRRVQMYRGG
jgi:ribosomal protein S18 acetylase RimI-like enzyme